MTKPIYSYSVSLTPVKKQEVAEPVSITKKMIYDLEDIISEMPPVECEIKHHFTHGVYARECVIPPNTVVTGAEFTADHLLIVAQGRCVVVNEGEKRELKAPAVIQSTAGVKRAIYTIEATTLITIHHSFTTDPDVVIEEISTSKADEMGGKPNNKQVVKNQLRELERNTI